MADKSQTRTGRRKQKKTKKKPIWKKIVLTVIIIILAIGIGIGGLFTYYIATAPAIDPDKLSDPFPSIVLDKNEEVVESLGSEQRTKVDYDDLPQVLIDAVVATEDSRFFKHHGIDLRRIGGAIKANILNGFGSEGASTITQQVVERSFLSPEKKLKIKVQEQWLALQLERKYSKEEILEMYLNKIYYGSGAYGVAKASETYFGKTDLEDLTIPEAAILAGLPQRPTAYDPYESPDLTQERMETVLTLMVRHGKITEEEAEEARQVDVESLLAGKRPDSKPYEAFIQQVQKEVEDKVDGADIYSDGLKIYTTLDPNAQEYIEFLLTDSDENPINYPADFTDDEGKEHQVQAGMVVLDTKTGAIQAIGGRRNNERNGSYNFAIGGGRQPGSTFKPIMAFGPAIEYNKWSTYHQINDDKPYEIAGTDKYVNNWNREFQGWLSARYALSQSLNVPTMKVFDEVGADKAKEFAEGLGLTFKDDKVLPTDAIGGTGSGYNPLDLAGAYRAFANEGIYNEPYAVSKVEFPDGKTVDLTPESEAAMSDYTAYMITDMLKTVMSEGTGKEADIPGLPVAGKTGTTNLEGKDGSPDSWFSGYTTNYTISIWTGYADTSSLALPDTKIPHALFKYAMTELSKDKETKDFKKPDSVVEAEVEKGSNPARKPSEYTPGDNIVTELFVKGHEPEKASKKYDKIDPVSNLSADYDEDNNSIKVEWDYDSDEDVSFEISASVNGGSMKDLSTTEDKSMKISDVEEDAEYEIEVVVVQDSGKSDPKTVKVDLSGEDNEEDIPAVSNLDASYDEDQDIIDVSWSYDGPDASFEVAVNGETQTVDSNGLEISGVSRGETYTITVTPKGKDNDEEGEESSIEVSVPDEESNEDAEDSQDDNTDNEDSDVAGDDSEDEEADQDQSEEQEENEQDEEAAEADSSDPENEEVEDEQKNKEENNEDDSGSNEDEDGSEDIEEEENE